jgi:formylglycine-generating enzyme required for sulfatase activity
MKFAWIAPGSFLMGSLPGEPGRANDEEQHRVTLANGFWMGVYEVTQQQWVDVMGSNPSAFKSDARCPVENISWYDCQKFCKKLTQREGRLYRLPTEPEWEYACRAGTDTLFCSGDTREALEKVSWFGARSEGKPKPVGLLQPNAWGLYDMHGNVWEWCAAWHEYPPAEGQQGKKGSPPKNLSVLRGGSWGEVWLRCRSAFRYGAPLDFRSHNIGFRVCISPEITQRG